MKSNKGPRAVVGLSPILNIRPINLRIMHGKGHSYTNGQCRCGLSDRRMP